MIIGYAFTAVFAILFLSLLVSAYFSRREIKKVFKGKIDRYSCLAAIVIVVFFVAVSIIYVHPVEQLYFDENIYQGIALNILHNGNALWCQYGSAYATQCPSSQIYHDPVEWSFYLAIAFLFFGQGISTAYGLQLFTGALSILLVFLLGSLLFGKRIGVASALVLALMPEIFIWSRTQAVLNLGFMMFSILAFLCYVIYDRLKTKGTLVLLLSALGIAAYMRIEAILLIPIFILVYFISEGRADFIKKLTELLYSKFDLNTIILIAFFVCLIPQIYYIIYEFNGLNYGNGTICGTASQHTFSLSNFMCNFPTNANYFFGQFNGVGYFPAYFSPITTAIAILGIIALLFVERKEKLKILMLIALWIFVYHIFYDFFYAGSVTYGVDVRFMLEIYPPIAILAALGIDALANLVLRAAKKITKLKNKLLLMRYSAILFSLLVIAFVLYPFAIAFNQMTLLPQNMPQEPGPLSATSFIYSHYSSVPANCLVFTFTPDIWYELNRSAAQIGYIGSSDSNFTSFASHFSCYVLDYGYWCVIPPYHTSTCQADISNYNLTAIASSSSYGTGNLTLYKLNNYVNK